MAEKGDPPSDEDLFGELERELEQVFPDPQTRKLLLTTLRGFLNLRDTAGGRVVFDGSARLSEEERARLSSPELQALYRERLARFYESGPDEEHLKMAVEAGLGPTFTPAGLKSLIGRAARRRTARTIRAQEIKGSEDGVLMSRKLRGTTLPPLSDTERARMARAIRFGAPRIYLAKEAAKAGNVEEAVELLVEGMLPASALLVRPTPAGEAYGRKNRSELLLPSDRKHCALPNCDKVVGNRETYCRVHAKSAIQEGDTRRKGRAASAGQLRRTIDRIANAPAEGESTFMGDALPEEFAPTLRKRRPIDQS